MITIADCPFKAGDLITGYLGHPSRLLAFKVYVVNQVRNDINLGYITLDCHELGLPAYPLDVHFRDGDFTSVILLAPAKRTSFPSRQKARS